MAVASHKKILSTSSSLSLTLSSKQAYREYSCSSNSKENDNLIDFLFANEFCVSSLTFIELVCQNASVWLSSTLWTRILSHIALKPSVVASNKRVFKLHQVWSPFTSNSVDKKDKIASTILRRRFQASSQLWLTVWFRYFTQSQTTCLHLRWQ